MDEKDNFRAPELTEITVQQTTRKWAEVVPLNTDIPSLRFLLPGYCKCY